MTSIPRHVVMLLFRAVIIMCLVVIAVRGTMQSTQWRTLVGFLPAMAALGSTLFAFERRPKLRPLAGIAWVLVFDLVCMGLMVATLGETSEPELLAFLLLGLVLATSRDLLAGTLAGLLAGVGFSYLAIRHGLAASPFEPLVITRATLFLAAGVFTGFLSREAEQEREVRAALTAELRQELADLSEHLKNVLASVASGVVAADADGRITTYNRAAQRILGVPEHKVVGRNLRDMAELAALVPVMLGPDAKKAADSHLEGLPPVGRPDIVFRRPDGREQRIGYATTPLEDIAGRRLGLILVFQDVTIIRDYEARMLRQEQLAALGRLVSGIAHEFGNLLGGARGHVDLALGGPPEEAIEALPIVKDTLDRALVTVENLLRFARGTPVNRTPGVAVDRVVDRVLHLLQVELDQKQVAVERRFADAPTICADATQLEQVFVNIVINAIHALHDRPDRRLRVSIKPQVEGEQVVVAIEDSGPGVPSELKNRIFEPFFTTKGPLGGSKIPGTGLGLSVALGLVEAHQGWLEVDRSPDLGGARFSVVLPSTDGEGQSSPVVPAA